MPITAVRSAAWPQNAYRLLVWAAVQCIDCHTCRNASMSAVSRSAALRAADPVFSADSTPCVISTRTKLYDQLKRGWQRSQPRMQLLQQDLAVWSASLSPSPHEGNAK